MERRKFEDSFRDAFQEAEITPSESVWTNIELDLERAEGGKMKRRLLFYKLLAAASVAFAMTMAGVGYYAMKNQTIGDGQLAHVKDDSNKSSAEVSTSDKADSNVTPTTASGNEDSNVSNDSNNTLADGTSTPDAHSNEFAKPNNNVSDASGKTGRSQITSDNAFALTATDQSSVRTPNDVHNSITVSNNDANTSAIDTHRGANANVFAPTSMAALNSPNSKGVNPLPSKIKPERAAASMAQVEADPVALMMAKQAQREKELQGKEGKEDKEKKNSTERLWTSVGVAAGGFSAVNTNVSPTASSFNAAADQQAKASGVAYTMGVSVGTRLSNKWVLQGGVNYQTQSSDYTANAVIGTSDFQNFYAASINNAKESLDSKVLSTAPYSVNNNLQFVSVPMQAGYLVINKKVGVQLNAGVSTDLFLQNTITPESGSLDKTSQGRGEDSPYRSVNFSGLVGTELTYKFGSHYRVALNPGLRYPINSIYKSDTGIESSPLTFDVGLRFRYIFQP